MVEEDTGHGREELMMGLVDGVKLNDGVGVPVGAVSLYRHWIPDMAVNIGYVVGVH